MMTENGEINTCHVRIRIPGQDVAERTISFFPCSIGRKEDNDLVIRDTSVSSYHAVLRIGEGGGLYLEDRGSTNGTFCDGTPRERILISRPLRLQLGDVIMDIALSPEGLNKLEDDSLNAVTSSVKHDEGQHETMPRIVVSQPIATVGVEPG
ncbi:MAG: FHA domain-containing protein, partial [Victivallales bacterium]|nr:FHA domain-containing protein [Victivallales bacterium]